jgi:hypothetical protein
MNVQFIASIASIAVIAADPAESRKLYRSGPPASGARSGQATAPSLGQVSSSKSRTPMQSKATAEELRRDGFALLHDAYRAVGTDSRPGAVGRGRDSGTSFAPSLHA